MGLIARVTVYLYGTEGHAWRVPGGRPMLMAAPNIQLCASHVLTGIEAISAPERRLFARPPPAHRSRRVNAGAPAGQDRPQVRSAPADFRGGILAGRSLDPATGMGCRAPRDGPGGNARSVPR